MKTAPNDQAGERTHDGSRKPSAASALADLAPFMRSAQLQTMREGLRGEERQFFADKLLELAGIVSTMPKTYEQDGKGDAAVVSLHYFAGGAANWWILERDADTDGEGQVQAFGLVNLFGGPNEPGAELGYISLPELLAAGGELDLHFAPQTLAELRGRFSVVEAAA